MTDYYTTQSLSTAAAAIEQGFKGCEYEWCHVEDIWKDASNLFEYAETWRFPRTLHNVELMEPVTGDIVKTQDPNDKHNYQLGYWEHVSCYSLLGTPTIIHRNNKPFPVWDKE